MCAWWYDARLQSVWLAHVAKGRPTPVVSRDLYMILFDRAVPVVVVNIVVVVVVLSHVVLKARVKVAIVM